MKKNNGITLIALVITIIVLLILAGVSIAMITSQDGILGKAKNAKVASALGTAKDGVNNAIAEAMTEYYQDKYVNATPTDNKDLIDFIADKIPNTADKFAKGVTAELSTKPASGADTTRTLTLTYTDNGKNSTVIGTVTVATGTIEWGDITYAQ